MSQRPRLHIIFTMDCRVAASRTDLEGPQSWEQSARSIDGYCVTLTRAGFPATLFLAPRCAGEHEPLLSEQCSTGVELGLFIHPPSLDTQASPRLLGQLRPEQQRAMVTHAAEQYQDALEHRPRTCRSAFYSASDATFAILADLGFDQGSISSPGRRVSRHAAIWTDAIPDAHYANRENRLRSGDLAFFEVPVSTDATQAPGGIAPELAIENGSFDHWHRPLIDAQLQRMENEQTSFRTLCLTTRNCFPFTGRNDRHGQTLQQLLDYLERLRETYEIVPATISTAHSSYRQYVGRSS